MKKIIALMAVVGGLALASGAYANSLTLKFDSTAAGTWNYEVISANSELQNGDFVTITGVQGVTSATGPAGWTGTFTASSVTWTWSGGTTDLTDAARTGFNYVSTAGGQAVDPYNSQDHVQNVSGHPISTVNGFVQAASTPDGGSAVALLGIAFAGIEGARRLFRARKA